MCVCVRLCAPLRTCVCTACLVSMAGRVGRPGDPGAGGETRGSAPMLEPRVGCPAGWVGWASPFRASQETSAHKSFGGPACWGRAGGCPGLASGLSLPCLVGRKGMGKKNPPDPARPWGRRQPWGWAWPGPLGWWPCVVMKFSKSSVTETLLPVFEGSRLGHLRLASCAFSAVATWGERNLGEGEEIQISLVPACFQGSSC